MCPTGFIDQNCSIKIDCKAWDVESGSWARDGVRTVVSPSDSAVYCETTHLTVFAGILDIPINEEQLAKQLKSILHFNVFTIDEAWEALSSFNVADNPTITLIVGTILALDVVSLLCCGVYRGHRKRLKRMRENKLHADEEHAAALLQLEMRAKKTPQLKQMRMPQNNAQALGTSAALQSREQSGSGTSSVTGMLPPRRSATAQVHRAPTQTTAPSLLFDDHNGFTWANNKKVHQRRRTKSKNTADRAEATAVSALSIDNKLVRTKACKKSNKLTTLCKRLVATFRSDHTVVALISPSEEEHSITDAQMTQLFWNTTACELFVVCFQHNFGAAEAGGVDGGGGGRRAGTGAAANTGSSVSTTGFQSVFAISPLEALTSGVIASLLTFTVVMLCMYAFKLSNSRRRPKRSRGWCKVIWRLWKPLTASEETVSKVEAAPQTYTEEASEASRIAERKKGRQTRFGAWKGKSNKVLPQVSNEVLPHVVDDAPSAAGAPGRLAVHTRMESPHVADDDSTATRAPDGLAEHARVESFKPVEDGERPAEEHHLDVEDQTSPQGQVVSVATPPPSPPREESTMPGKGVPVPRLPLKQENNKGAREQQQGLDLSVVAMGALLKKRKEDLRWRSPREVIMRRALAWSLSVFFMLASCWYALVIALRFGEDGIRSMAISWLLAYGLTFALIEPVQIVVIVSLPMLFDEETKVGRCCERCRYVYNELLAP